MQINQDKLDVIKTIISSGEAYKPTFEPEYLLNLLGIDPKDVDGEDAEASLKIAADGLAKYLGQLADSILAECKA